VTPTEGKQPDVAALEHFHPQAQDGRMTALPFLLVVTSCCFLDEHIAARLLRDRLTPDAAPTAEPTERSPVCGSSSSYRRIWVTA
jgi:hypothetical protein